MIAGMLAQALQLPPRISQDIKYTGKKKKKSPPPGGFGGLFFKKKNKNFFFFPRVFDWSGAFGLGFYIIGPVIGGLAGAEFGQEQPFLVAAGLSIECALRVFCGFPDHFL